MIVFTVICVSLGWHLSGVISQRKAVSYLLERGAMIAYDGYVYAGDPFSESFDAGNPFGDADTNPFGGEDPFGETDEYTVTMDQIGTIGDADPFGSEMATPTPPDGSLDRVMQELGNGIQGSWLSVEGVDLLLTVEH